MIIDLRLLRSFVLLADERHFGRAAARLGIAQPPLSQQIRRLEAQLGAELVDRSSRPIALTPAGEAMLAEARLALSHADRAVTAARRAAVGHVGQLHVGAMQAAVQVVVPPVLRSYRARFPDVSVSLLEAGSAEQIARLLEDRLDVGFVRGMLDEPALEVEPVAEDPLAAALPAGHRLAAGPVVDVPELAGEPLVLTARHGAPTTYADVIATLRQHDVEPRVVHETETIQATLGLVAAGFGVALLPASFAALGRADITFRALRGPLPHRPLTMAWRPGDDRPIVRALLEVARATRIPTAV